MNRYEAPCVRCGALLHTGEGRIVMSFTDDELAELIDTTLSMTLRNRLLCALGLIDPDREKELR